MISVNLNEVYFHHNLCHVDLRKMWLAWFKYLVTHIYSHTPSHILLPSRPGNVPYHPHIFICRYSNWGFGSGFVNISASWLLVLMYSTWILGSSPSKPFVVHDLKWWYWIAKCFVLGRILGALTNSIAPALSSKTRHWIFGCVFINFIPFARNSSVKFIMKITLRHAWLNAWYSASVADKAIVLCNFQAHKIGHPAYLITYLVRDRQSLGSKWFSLFYPSINETFDAFSCIDTHN